MRQLSWSTDRTGVADPDLDRFVDARGGLQVAHRRAPVGVECGEGGVEPLGQGGQRRCRVRVPRRARLDPQARDGGALFDMLGQRLRRGEQILWLNVHSGARRGR